MTEPEVPGLGVSNYSRADERNAAAPTQPGWYVTAHGVSDSMVYSLDQSGHWHAFTLEGASTDCEWDYIAQAGPVTCIAPYPRGSDENSQMQARVMCDQPGCARPVEFVSQVGGFHWCELHGLGRNASRIVR